MSWNIGERRIARIKADPAFSSFRQITTDPSDRVFVGEIPPELERVRQNTTKYMASLMFEKVQGSPLNEHWFSGTIPLNSGLIAVIGNREQER